MSIELLQKALPAVEQWMKDTLAHHAPHTQPVSSLPFPRLGQFYPASLLQSAKFVVVDAIPVPPLTALGLTGFEDFEKQEMEGLTFFDTYFVLTENRLSEALHFHELVHVVQCQHLGTADFLLG